MYLRLFFVYIFCVHITAYATTGFSDAVSTLLVASESLSVQLILSLLLGLLLSLTPCIYPMIPITIGILQSHNDRSFWHNVSRALAYTCGVATTFALLGLMSAFTGTLFGSLMASPLVILPMVTFLLYLTGAMIGLYEMYVPRFFQQHNTGSGSSLLAAFSFGAASGTVASPCLSPGLVLLLSIVSTTGNPITGFVLLFAFGIGLSIPLLIIGIFSGSMHILPHAGMWMVYVKQLFGLMMIGICLYLLKPLVNGDYLNAIGAILYCIAGIALLIKHYNTHQKITFNGQTGISIVCFAIGILFLWCPIFKPHTDKEGIRIAWCTHYPDAHQQALAENKNLLVEVNAPYCSICTAIEGKFFCEKSVCSALGTCIPVQINGADSSIEVHEKLKKQYNIVGAPTLLLIDPKTGQELARWGSELYDATVDEFVEQLNSY